MLLTEGDADRSFDLSQLPVTDMHVETASDNSSASIYVSKGNSLFTYTQVLTVYKGLQFVNMSIALQSKSGSVKLRWMSLVFETKGELVNRGNTVGYFDEGGKVLAQLIFPKEQPKFSEGGPELLYTLSDESKTEFEIWVSVFSVPKTMTTLKDPRTITGLAQVMEDNVASYQMRVKAPELDVFDYRKALADWNVFYIAVRDSEIIPKFARDPAFSLLFINDEVAIFIVK